MKKSLLILFLMLFSFLEARIDFLPAEKVLNIKTSVIEDNIKITFLLAKDIYLYKDKVALDIENTDVKIVELKIPKGKYYEGKEVYYNNQSISATLKKLSNKNNIRNIKFTLKYQGCSKAGICYKPETKILNIEVDMTKVKNIDGSINKEESNENSSSPIVDLLKNGNIIYIIFGFFLFGLLLSITPCVFPMVPILSSVIVSYGSNMTTKKAFLLSMVYVQAMAITYTIVGVIAGLTGEGLQAAFQTPWVISIFSLVFVVLAISMFGLFDIQVPKSLQSYLMKKSDKKGNEYISIGIMGALSALIVGPCVAAPLAAALGFISQSGDAFLGGIALYFLSIGMGIPLLIVGTGAGKWMPKPGKWMDNIKNIFGILMLGIAIWMISRIIEENITMLLWSALIIFISINIGVLEHKKKFTQWYALKKTLGILILLYGSFLFVTNIGQSNISKKESNEELESKEEKNIKKKVIHSMNELNELLSLYKGKKVLVDFYAKWCTSCKELDKITFANNKVKKALEKYKVIKVDITKNTEEEKEIIKAFGLFGPPALIFYNKDGIENKEERQIGFINVNDMLEKLERLN